MIGVCVVACQTLSRKKQYRESFELWETTVNMQKFSTVVIAVFLKSEPVAQAWMAIGVVALMSEFE